MIDKEEMRRGVTGAKPGAHITEMSSFALIIEFFLSGATERNTR